MQLATNYISYSIVIPIFNEKENIPFLYHGLKKAAAAIAREYEIIFVDDGSTDGSIEILRREAGGDESVKLIESKRHLGKSQALQSGFECARGRYIVTMDGDCQYDPEDIQILLKKIEVDRLDVICGWRRQRRDSFLKVRAARAANYLRRAIFNESIHDVGCPLRIYAHRALEGVSLKGEEHRFITAILKRKGFTIGEVAVRHYPRRQGQSKYGIMDRLIKSIPEFFSLIISKVRH